jgi:hypothetical protein
MGKAVWAALLLALFAGRAAAGAPSVSLGGAAQQADLKLGLGAADDGKRVHLRGVIDVCLPDGCTICPGWDKASHPDEVFRRSGCLSLISWKDTNAALLLDELYRFSEVEITGRFHFEAPSQDGVAVFCLDFRRCGQSGFEDVVVNRLIERRAVEKVPDQAPGDAIVPIAKADDAALRKLFWEDPDFSLVFLEGPDTEVRTYTRPPKDSGAALKGWLCYARKSVAVNTNEPFPWPTSYRAIELRSPANPYRCRLAWKEKGAWRIVRELQKLPVYGLD